MYIFDLYPVNMRKNTFIKVQKKFVQKFLALLYMYKAYIM